LRSTEEELMPPLANPSERWQLKFLTSRMRLCPAKLCAVLRCSRPWTDDNSDLTFQPASYLSRARILSACFTVVFTIRAVGASLVCEQHEGYRLAPLLPSAAGKPGFTSLPATATGVLFTNLLLPEAEVANQNLLNGAGLALGDYDNDGWCDL